MWAILSNHLVQAASHANSPISMFAVDSLRQLAQKLFEVWPTRQAELFEPFRSLLELKTLSPNARGVAASSVQNLTAVHAKVLGPRLQVLFHILVQAATDPEPAVVESAYISICMIVEKNVQLFTESVTDGISVLISLAQRLQEEQALRMISQLAWTSDFLSKQKSNFYEDGNVNTTDGMQQKVTIPWFSCLRGLAVLVNSEKPQIRGAALARVFECLDHHARRFLDAQDWHIVFETIIRPLTADVLDHLLNGDEAVVEAVELLLAGLHNVDPSTMKRYLPDIYSMLCELVLVQSHGVRSHVQKLLLLWFRPDVRSAESACVTSHGRTL